MTLFLLLWLIAQAISAALVWRFTVGLGQPVRIDRFPHVAVIVAVKGRDEGFDEFLVQMFEQNYPVFRVIFAVESADDDAVPAIEKYRAIAPDRITLVIADRRDDEGQKTTNLRAAVTKLASADEILVFADADIWPARDWLRSLVAPLLEARADVVSGFPWLVVKDGRVSSFVLAAMAASVATVPRLALLNAAWGGSIAIRHDQFIALGMAERWRGTLSDDLQFTNVIQRAHCKILAPREVLLRTPLRTSGWGEVADEARRWYLLVRIHMPAAYALTIVAMSFSALGWVVSLLGTLIGRPDAAAILLAAALLSVVRTLGRARLVRILWGEAGLAENKAFLRLDPLVSPLAVVLNAILGWSALFTTRTSWSGVTYEIKGPQDVRVLSRVQ